MLSHDFPGMNWAGNVRFGSARRAPTRIDRRSPPSACSWQQSKTTRALGYGHSFSRIADTAHDLVLMNGLPNTLTIDSASSSVTVASGMNYAELAAELQRSGYALPNMASIPNISIAGASATGTHGSGDTQRSRSLHPWLPCSLSVPDGDLIELRRDSDRRHFSWLSGRLALVLWGVVTQLTLDIEPTYDCMSQGVHLDVSAR